MSRPAPLDTSMSGIPVLSWEFVPRAAAGRSVAPQPGLSLCMIVRNEEAFLADALASVRGEVDEICIVDTGSTDQTVAIAESFGARVRRVTWRDDFAWARNQSLAMASHAWILVLDADERLAPTAKAALRELRRQRPDGRGRWIRCRNMNDDYRGAGASSNAIVRIFPNDPAVDYRGALHEFVARDGEEHSLGAVVTSIEIHHFGYLSDVIVKRDKADRNLRLSRAAFDAAPDDPFNIYNYAMSAMLAGDAETARVQLERACDITVGTPRGFRPQALATLAGIYLTANDPERGLETAERCIAIAPTFPDAHFLRGRALVTLGRIDDGRRAFADAIAAGKHAGDHFVVDDEVALWKAHNELAVTFMKEDRFADAERWLELALANRPAVAPLLFNRARCREGQGDLEGALAIFRACFEAYHDEPAAIEYVNFVLRHASPEQAEQAVEAATLPVLTASYQRVFLATLAGTMLRADKQPEARALARRALAVDGDEREGRAIIAALAEHYRLPGLAALLAFADEFAWSQ